MMFQLMILNDDNNDDDDEAILKGDTNVNLLEQGQQTDKASG